MILKIGDDFADADFAFLANLLKLIDSDLKIVNTKVYASRDPESDGLADSCEFLIGSGFVAIQRYLTAAYSWCGVKKDLALKIPPHISPEVTYAEALHEIANYWKHSEEWYGEAFRGKTPSRGRRTIEMIEKILPDTDLLTGYPCSNILAALLQGNEFELSNLLPWIAEWRENLWSKHLHI